MCCQAEGLAASSRALFIPAPRSEGLSFLGLSPLRETNMLSLLLKAGDRTGSWWSLVTALHQVAVAACVCSSEISKSYQA